MRPVARRIVAAALGLLVAGCAGAAPGNTPRPTALRGKPKLGTSATTPIVSEPTGGTSPGKAPDLVVPPGPSASVVANNGATNQPTALTGLAGRVLAPATLIGNNGAGVISNNGGGVVSNNGGGYRLAQAAALGEVPVVGVEVVLLDAAGRPVFGVDGQPLRATTDAQGGFRFPIEQVPNNWIIEAALPEERGRLQAIAPGALAAGQAAAAPPPLVLDLVSTLATTYILDQYVRTQEDRQKTLDRLPPDVERETREKTEDALVAGLQAGRVALPTVLATTSVVATVDVLRQADRGLDDQLEKVKKLLIVAGLSDLGAGQNALSVVLGDVTGLAAGPDGRLYVNSGDLSRIWRLEADGKLATAVGSGAPASGSVDGVAGPQAALREPERMLFDAKGRLLIQERTRLVRLEPDGKLTELWTLPQTEFLNPFFVLALPAPGDEVQAFVITPTAFEIWAIAPDKTRRKLLGAPRHYSAKETGVAGLPDWRFFPPTDFGIQADGKVVLGRGTVGEEAGSGLRLLGYDPATQKFGAGPALGGAECVTLDAGGRPYVMDPDSRKVEALLPGGGREPVVDALPDELELGLSAVRLPDGAIYLSAGPQVFRATGGELVPAAGLAETRQTAAGLALKTPSAAVATAAGDVYLVESEDSQILRLRPGKPAEVFAGEEEEFGGISLMGMDRDERLYVPDDDVIHRIDTRSASPTIERHVDLAALMIDGRPVAAQVALKSMGVAPDGTLYLLGDRKDGGEARSLLLRVAPDGRAVTELRESEESWEYGGVACAPSGEVFVMARGPGGFEAPVGRLYLWTDAGGLALLKEDREIPGESAHMAVDSKGRVTFTQGWIFDERLVDRIWRYDPATDAFATLAGPGGVAFAGRGVDDSVSSPAYPSYDAAGDLLFTDIGHNQVKRIPAEKLL